ncbi:hypothetical protein [Sorangium sp. So ce233]|uniref:hypothetical protein n=1 Tax=Sorangium sp. So ce233 TaxID=3133290 RepID=UPI003F64227C
MTWTIISNSHYEKQLSKANLSGSEEQKIDAWLGLVPSIGPYDAAKEAVGPRALKKLQGASANQWELILGAYLRLSFTDTGFHQIELLSIGHT